MSDDLKQRFDAVERRMRSGSPGNADEIQRRLRANWQQHELTPDRIADICARLASADASGRAALRAELVASGLPAAQLDDLGL